MRIAFIATAILILQLCNLGVSCGAEGLTAEGAEVTRLAGDFVFTEGPATDVEGNVYFSDIPNNRIHKWSLDGKLTTVREETGRANGLYFDQQGNLLACEGGNRRVTSMDSTGKLTVLADHFNGKKLNSPNDLWIDPQGGVYFTDPRYGNEDGLEQSGFHVYYIPPGKGTVIRVLDGLVKPNGIIGTSDGKTVFVADAGANKTYRYRVASGGKLVDARIAAPEGSDGMTLDERGNLYLTRRAVVVYSIDGSKIETIEVPEPPANITFGGKDRKTLFITARQSFYSVRMSVRGQ